MNCDPANPKGSGVVNVWQEVQPIRFGSIDKSDRLTLNSIFQFFQEAAISHAENLGVGREALAKTGQAWIISRMTVQVERRPNYNESVTVRSWPRGFEKLFAIRDYQIRDKDEAAVVFARSAWLIVDIEKRRPLRPQIVMDYLPMNDGLETLIMETPSLADRSHFQPTSDLQKVMERKALYTDLDYNGHVNNVRYIQWIEDSLDPQMLEKADKMRLEINYINEVLSGDVIEIFSAPLAIDGDSAKVFALEGRKTESETAVFRAELRLW